MHLSRMGWHSRMVIATSLNKAFASARWDLPGGAGASVIHFVDPSRTMRDGYASMTFLSSAISNMVRTKSDAGTVREPGMVMPLYADLVKDTRPVVAMSYWSGDDFISESRGDRSVLATLASILGVGDVMPFIGGAIVGGAIGANAAEEHMQDHSDDDHHEDAEDEDGMKEEDSAAEDHKEKTPY
jgi:hypothetical protein